MEKEKIRNKKEITGSIYKGLNEALEFSVTKKENSKLRISEFKPIPDYQGNNVKRIRKKLRLTQRKFAYAMGVSIKTVESWEANRNKPNGTAQRFLYLLNRNPNIIKEIENA